MVQRARDSFAADKRFRITASEPNRVILRLYTRGINGKDPQTAYNFTVTFKLADTLEELFAGQHDWHLHFKRSALRCKKKLST